MNYKSKIEAYKLLRKGDFYLIVNISDEYNDKEKVSLKEKNKQDSFKKKKKVYLKK